MQDKKTATANTFDGSAQQTKFYKDADGVIHTVPVDFIPPAKPIVVDPATLESQLKAEYERGYKVGFEEGKESKREKK